MTRNNSRYYPRPAAGQTVHFAQIANELRHLGITHTDRLRVYYDVAGREVGWRAYRAARSTVGIWTEDHHLAQAPTNWSLFVMSEMGPDHWAQRNHELNEAGAVRYDEYTRTATHTWKLLPPHSTADDQIVAELTDVAARLQRRDLGAYFTIEALALRLAERATPAALILLRQAIQGIPITDGWQSRGARAFASLAAAPHNDQAAADAQRALELALTAEPNTLIDITPFMPEFLLDTIALAAADLSRSHILRRLRQHIDWRRAALARQGAATIKND